ncbi:hypothetical protein ACX0G9_05280 [Flavitalea flava]
MNKAASPETGRQKPALLVIILVVFHFFSADCQYLEKVSFDARDSTNGYYMAIPPSSATIKGVLVFFCSFRNPESLLPETKLHNVAAASDMLTIYASLGKKIAADSSAINRINGVLKHVAEKYKADTSQFVMGGFDMAGAIVIRFTEMANEHPSQFAVCPKAVFAVSSFVDLTGLYHWSERQIKKNAFPPSVNDARFFLDMMNKEQGTPADHPGYYKSLSPFSKEEESPGNERFLHQVAVRLYYDADINWQLNARGNSLYDTNIPDGTELINRLQLSGNTRAEFIASKQPGVRSNGMRNATAMSIVDETDCMQWIKKVLHIFDPNNPLAWVAPYRFIKLDGWTMERNYFPAPYAPHVTLTGMEDIRFPKGWGDAGSEEYWSVAYLFWLDGGQKIDGDVLQKNLKLYYDDLVPGGLVRRNINFPSDKIPPAKVTIKKTKTAAGDLETYTGTIDMLDYMQQKPMTLNYRIHVKTCSVQNKIPVLLNISPKPFDHPIWGELDKMREKFACEE